MVVKYNTKQLSLKAENFLKLIWKVIFVFYSGDIRYYRSCSLYFYERTI
ncbi:hypothetical protein HNP81_003310 [Peribacillus huizhouensis]|uniref:Uncharacterized protein n=1 Tax=Peribacillus huizhouensis TaxID=1501239 RepID=A0ABR6CTD3_9BACI|nr:hypothetical protein [Peribacillus huizhouensis]